MALIIDNRLLNTCYKVVDTEISTILLSKNSLVTWLIIVPKTKHTEWYELDAKLQGELNNQISKISKILKEDLDCDKVNIATIGNLVSQMHIHVVGRRKDDFCWPDVIWGKKEFKEYQLDDLNHIKTLVTQNFIS